MTLSHLNHNCSYYMQYYHSLYSYLIYNLIILGGLENSSLYKTSLQALKSSEKVIKYISLKYTKLVVSLIVWIF